MLTFFMQPTAAHGISCFYPSHSDSQSDYHNIFQDVHTVKRRKQLPFPNVSSHIPSAPAWLNWWTDGSGQLAAATPLFTFSLQKVSKTKVALSI